MTTDDMILLGKSDQPVEMALKYMNRHGLISGATGTGKTVTLQIIIEALSRAGVPSFVADVKGDLSGLGAEGADKDFLTDRAEKIDLEGYGPEAMPTVFWDLHGDQGHPVRATVTEMGPLLLSQLLELNDTQEGVLAIAFRVAEDEALPLLDLKDLRALLVNVSDRRAELSVRYGNISPASVAAIQRRLLQLEDQGAEKFFGEPRLDLRDFLRTARDGRGQVNILAADKLMMTPKLYSTFLLWLLSELFEELPEIGDPEKPILVFFFDEAHLLFDDAPRALLDRIEQVVRLIRSKGVGVFFCTQSPLDVPDSVSRQLGNRVQHALRAYTPRERKAVKAAAETFRANPDFDTLEVISELGIGEALVSTLLKKGVPAEVERTLIRPPSSRLGPLTEAEREERLRADGFGARYDKTIDRDSAAEILAERAERAAREAEAEAARLEKEEAREKKSRSRSSSSRSRRMSSTERAVNQAIRTGTSTLMRELIRGLLGTLKRR